MSDGDILVVCHSSKLIFRMGSSSKLLFSLIYVFDTNYVHGTTGKCFVRMRGRSYLLTPFVINTFYD